jgi:hypothetical protein
MRRLKLLREEISEALSPADDPVVVALQPTTPNNPRPKAKRAVEIMFALRAERRSDQALLPEATCDFEHPSVLDLRAMLVRVIAATSPGTVGDLMIVQCLAIEPMRIAQPLMTFSARDHLAANDGLHSARGAAVTLLTRRGRKPITRLFAQWAFRYR